MADRIQDRARALRKEMTPQERHLWYDFLRTYPVRFRRQNAIGPYIADFYCHQAKLVIELDGSQHYEPEEEAYDNRRTAYLQELGIQVIRYGNNQINGEFREVCEQIDRIVKERLGI